MFQLKWMESVYKVTNECKVACKYLYFNQYIITNNVVAKDAHVHSEIGKLHNTGAFYNIVTGSRCVLEKNKNNFALFFFIKPKTYLLTTNDEVFTQY